MRYLSLFVCPPWRLWLLRHCDHVELCCTQQFPYEILISVPLNTHTDKHGAGLSVSNSSSTFYVFLLRKLFTVHGFYIHWHPHEHRKSFLHIFIWSALFPPLTPIITGRTCCLFVDLTGIPGCLCCRFHGPAGHLYISLKKKKVCSDPLPIFKHRFLVSCC